MWNKSLCAWKYGIRVGWMGKTYRSVLGRMGCGRDMVWRGTGVVVCATVYWRCLKGAVVRLISCNAPLKRPGYWG
ncbi:hypothetical protein NP493_177g03001 [Ridgeia piscesae]|uniref:Uncharacterized protein n=1 Tax=Ridgeia piscesae TaxID=27915 RepID=A0AAD9P2V6_RIDPI|nr:hypothetical protein NP493_177g03001 [Ridgeia piscesae]